ncbi:MAG: poly(3-hydroxyalkanoate) depolymerase [Bacteroidota bacterium]
MHKDRIFQRIVSHLEEMLPNTVDPGLVKEDAMLTLLGASSVERAELIERMLEELDLKADRFEFHSANNLGELAELLAHQYQREKSTK